MTLAEILAAINDLRGRRGNLRDLQRALIATVRARGATAEMTEEERDQFDERMAQIERINGDETRLLALEADERARLGSNPSNPPTPENPANPSPDQGWRSMGEFLQAVYRAEQPRYGIDRRLVEAPESRAATGANETVPSDGGYLVQTDFTTALMTRTNEVGILTRNARRIPISGNANGTKINGVNETSRATGSRWGGVQVYRAAEADTVAASRPRFRQIKLDLEKLMGFCYATDEVLQDAAQLEAVIMQAFPEEFAWKIDNEAFRGNGAGQMLGVTQSPALVTVSKEVGQSAASFYYENAVKMYSRMWAPSIPRSTWYINQDVMPQLFLMAMVIGTGGVPVFLPPGAASAAPYGTLLGRPIQPIEQASTLGTVGDVTLLDMSQYLMIEKGGLQSASSIHVRFLNDEQVFRFTMRNNGEPIWPSPLTPANGTSTVSPFVALETRS